LVELEDEGCAEGIEGLGAVELDWEVGVRDGIVVGDGGGNSLKPTPGLGVETSRCSYVFDEAYPRAKRGKAAGRNCEATRAVERKACMTVDWLDWWGIAGMNQLLGVQVSRRQDSQVRSGREAWSMELGAWSLELWGIGAGEGRCFGYLGRRERASAGGCGSERRRAE
jgi:hypothetical protein